MSRYAQDYKEQWVDDSAFGIETVDESLDYALNSGYPDFTSGVNRLSGSGIAPLSGRVEAAASAAAPAPKPAILRNRRREMRFMTSFPRCTN